MDVKEIWFNVTLGNERIELKLIDIFEIITYY